MLIGSVRDSRRVNDVFRRFRPDIVYHAAAHKHVPLMEDSPCEAIKNNVIGTYKVAYAAMIYGTHRFVLISTDKAVNPTNIMGASKRLCELVVQSFDKMIKSHREADIPVLHVHQEDEDGSKYPLAEDTQRVDADGKKIFTFPGQDDKGHRKAQTEYSMVRFGADVVLRTSTLRPHKYWVSSSCKDAIMLLDVSNCSSEIVEKHGLSIPAVNPIILSMINSSTKILRQCLKIARKMCDVYQLMSCNIFGLKISSNNIYCHCDGLVPLLI